MTTIYERLRDTWLANGVSINDGATPLALNEFEKENHIKLPVEFRDYLSISNGMVDGQTDKYLISFLSLDTINHEISSRTRQLQDSVDIAFAEYLVYSHYYTLRATENGTPLGVYVMDGTNEKLLASSFYQFIHVYLSNPRSVAYCW